MKIIALTLLSLTLAAQGALSAQGSLTKVETTFDKKADFRAFHTYRWMAGFDAFNPDVRKLVVAAFDAEMAKLGFTKVEAGGDVTLAYYTVARQDVDPKSLDKITPGGEATKTVGRLVAIIRSGRSSEQVWSASTREFVDPDPAKLADTIRTATARLFETYPRPK